MLMMRLQRVGRKNEAHFKIVVIEKTKGPKSHKYVDIVGSYNPKMGQVNFDIDSAKQWLSNGVQPSDTVRNMLIDKGILEGRKVNVLPKKAPTKKRNAPEIEEVKEEPVVESAPEEVVPEEPVSEPVTEAPTETPEEAPQAEEVSETPTEETEASNKEESNPDSQDDQGKTEA